MDHENRTECLEGAASDMRKEDCEESDGAIASRRTAIRDKAPRLAVEDEWSDCDHESNHKQPGVGQGDHRHDSASQAQDVGCSETQGCRSRDGRTPNGHPSDDEGGGSHRGGVVGHDATAATNVRGQKPPFEDTHVPRPVTSSPEGGTQAPETAIFGDVVIDVSISSPFLVDVQASGRSWSAYCSVALVVISVVSAGFFICMSFHVFSVVRVHDGPEEYRDLQNDASEPMADQAHAASTSVVAMAADEEEVGMTGDGDVE
ncbi:hypothetical protein MRX96_048379 [Rhipicephalus microplus]